MGSLETRAPAKRIPILRSSSPASGAGRSFFRRPRSRIARFLLFEKVDYLQWVFIVAIFFFVVVIIQAFLPGSVVERSLDRGSGGGRIRDVFAELGELDFGQGIRFVPTKLLESWERDSEEAKRDSEEANKSASALGRPVTRFGLRKPRLALVVPDLWPDAMQLQMLSIAALLKEIGYEIQVFSLKDGPLHATWRTLELPVNILLINGKQGVAVDWLDYNGILVHSIEARPLLSSLLQEPFKTIPVIWIIHEKSLALRLGTYAMNSQFRLVTEWKESFSRATVIVFSSHVMPLMYSELDSGNFFVIAGSPAEAMDAVNISAIQKEDSLNAKSSHESDDFIVAIVSSQFSYSGMLLEHALILEALVPLLKQIPSVNTSYSPLKIVVVNGNFTTGYKLSLQAVAQNAGYPNSIVEHIFCDGDMNRFLSLTDLVVYGSFLEEQAFPNVLIQAMSLGKLVVAPDLNMITKYVDDRINGYIFPKEKVAVLSQIVLEAVSNGKLSPFAQQIALKGKEQARNLLASEALQGYTLLLEKVLKLPSEILSPKSTEEIPQKLKEQWQWHLFANISKSSYIEQRNKSDNILDRLEAQWNHSQMNITFNYSKNDEAFSYIVWEEEKKIGMMNARKYVEEEELKDRTDQPHGTWDEVYRNVKKADRAKNEFHERDDRELERTGQPLCIYEPYFGEGTWPFLHQNSLYRGIGLSSKGRRPRADDIDASSRLPLLDNVYYRDLLGEYGAFFALANRIDRVHKNAWIGFQSWRASARKANLSRKAETTLLEVIQTRRHGDTLYFWTRMDNDPRNPRQLDFWDFCDTINAGNCRHAVTKALQRMFGLEHDWNSLPEMPHDGGSWSVSHSWALPTRSFLEFVMFSRMFVDAMDAEMYEEHHQNGRCYLSLTNDRHCYSRILELLVNVWAYHSARHIVYIDPETGAMQEQHKLRDRKGKMWIKWFSYATLKGMDEDLAEEADVDHPDRRWLWPSTGEVFWQGVYERERSMRHHQKEKRKQESRDKIQRIRSRARQKTLGRFIKPPPDGTDDLNTARTQ